MKRSFLKAGNCSEKKFFGKNPEPGLKARVSENACELSLEVYKKLTSRKYRAGSVPSGDVKEKILEKIRLKLAENKPVELFQFWGGCKNSNLSSDVAGLCEEATLDNLYRLNLEVKKVYSKGLKIYVSPGDKRVEKVNHVPCERTKKYVETLKSMAESKKYKGLFCVVPVSCLYSKYKSDFEEKLFSAGKKLSSCIENHPAFFQLAKNARKNINKNKLRESNFDLLCKKAAKDYVIYRVAEEEAEIFRDFEDCIRAFFIRYSLFYRQYISDLDKTKPHLDCSLVFFTGCPGNVTQPWQAIGKKEGEKVLFLSQEKLKKLP